MSVGFQFKELAKLFRLSVAFTPIADVVTGYTVCMAIRGASLPFDPALISTCAASIGVFCFTTSLNDYLDRHKDAYGAPERPLPSGKISPNTAVTASIITALLALVLASFAGLRTLTAVTLVLFTCFTYNLWSRRIDWLGVINLGFIRAANLFVGMSLIPVEDNSIFLWFGSGWEVSPGITLFLYFTYGISLSTVALAERGQRSWDIRIPAAMAAMVGLVPLWKIMKSGFFWPGLILWLVLAVPILRYGTGPHRNVSHLVGHFVSGFFLLGALMVLAAGCPLTCALLWILYAVSRGLARWFPPS